MLYNLNEEEGRRKRRKRRKRLLLPRMCFVFSSSPLPPPAGERCTDVHICISHKRGEEEKNTRGKKNTRGEIAWGMCARKGRKPRGRGTGFDKYF